MFVERGEVLLTPTRLAPVALGLQGNEIGSLPLVRLWPLPLILWRAWHVSCQDHEGWPPLWNELLESSALGFAAPVDSSPSAPEASPAAFFICLRQPSPQKNFSHLLVSKCSQPGRTRADCMTFGSSALNSPVPRSGHPAMQTAVNRIS